MDADRVNVGIAGWALRSEHASSFPADGTHLARYAARYPAVEINSSFYRPHQAKTYARWADSVPQSFRFSVKAPKAITHDKRLRDAGALVERFTTETAGLGAKLGAWLVQLPPSLALEEPVAREFFRVVRSHYDGPVACEPRHRTWFTAEAGALLVEFGVARVAADPATVPEAALPGGVGDLVYYRLHGSPRMYYSAYSDAYLAELAAKLQAATKGARNVWCIFDNTAEGAAHVNAMQLQRQLAQPS